VHPLHRWVCRVCGYVLSGGAADNAGPLKGAVEAVARLADAKGALNKAPPSLGSKSLTELLDEGGITAEVDPKYPQALGINSILHHQSIFGNSSWEVVEMAPREGLFEARSIVAKK
jgi:hypothetical protein